MGLDTSYFLKFKYNNEVAILQGSA